jgi:hypothetical protein
MKVSKRLTAPRPRIDVIQEDIDHAIPKNSGLCMVAQGVYRAVPSAIHVFIDLQTIRWTDRNKGLRYIYLTPRLVQIALYKWDWGIKPKPFSFQLRGAQIVSAQITKIGPDGKKSQPRAHKLGRAKLSIAPNQSKKVRVKPDTIGGRAPKITRFAYNKRVFGQRSISLSDIFGEGIPEALIKELQSLPRA